MREFLPHIHSQLSRMTLIHKLEDKLSEEDNEQLQAIRGTVSALENFAEQSKNGDLYQIADDFWYCINNSPYAERPAGCRNSCLFFGTNLQDGA